MGTGQAFVRVTDALSRSLYASDFTLSLQFSNHNTIHHMAPSNDIAAFRAVLKDSKSIVVVAAADLSTASGQ